MKAAIITLHRFDNVGSCLQACALSQYLHDKLDDVYLIDYTPHYRQYYAPMKLLALIFNRTNVKRRMKKIGEALSDNTKLTKRFHRKKQVINELIRFDLLIAGGDQIWNPMYPNYYDDSFYFYGVENRPKISYGSSVSVSELSESQINYLQKRIAPFESVNVREKKTAELFKKYHINDNTHYVMDPVFLLNKQWYSKLAEKSKLSESVTNEPFILAYHLDPCSELNETINKLKEITGYRIISLIGNRKYWYSDIYLRDYGPYDFLWLIQHAKIVLTGSFHALCFSLIFGTQFMVQLPEKSPNRILNILGDLDCLDRILTKSNSPETLISKKINEHTYTLLDILVNASQEQLNQAIAAYKERI